MAQLENPFPFQSNPFIRRKCNPRIVTKTKDDQMDEEALIQMAAQGSESKENKKEVGNPALRAAIDLESVILKTVAA